MFTGLIEEIGTIAAVARGRFSSVLTIGAQRIFSDLKPGDSVAVDGVCLTAAEIGNGRFTADVMHETLNRSTLGALRPGSRVNLERAMAADGRFGGHIVAGHIDGTGEILRMVQDDNAVRCTIRAAPALLRGIVEKGSIAVDGISLTVSALEADRFEVSLIPHTGRSTTLLEKRAGSRVNLENDVIGKYVARLLGGAQAAPAKPERGVDMAFLQEHGFL